MKRIATKQVENQEATPGPMILVDVEQMDTCEVRALERETSAAIQHLEADVKLLGASKYEPLNPAATVRRYEAVRRSLDAGIGLLLKSAGVVLVCCMLQGCGRCAPAVEGDARPAAGHQCANGTCKN